MLAFFEIAANGRAKASEVTALVDVIVPVYRGYDDTLACIWSVLRSKNDTVYQLIVVDDCSPEPELSSALELLADLGLITLLKNEENLGFVGTVNRGMSLHLDRDVILLNSDTLVYGNWIDRISEHVRRAPDVATVTPFTNNGTVCSYPRFCADNKELLDIPFERLDALLAKQNARQSVDVPTGVGFCFYITRLALERVGLFDIDTFGKGYGEENDFCMRAGKLGMRNLHALDVFVFHSGETSFADTASESKRRGLQALEQKHPEYRSVIQQFLQSDPARAARIVADAARLKGESQREARVCISHSVGGGIERYLYDYARHKHADGEDVYVMASLNSTAPRFRLFRPGFDECLPNLEDIDLELDAHHVVRVFEILRVKEIEVHSTVGWPFRMPLLVERLSRLTGLPYSAMLHDYVPICPQINLINESGFYCGEDGETQCRRCLSNSTSQARIVHPDLPTDLKINIEGWRALYGRMLAGARRVTAPSADVKSRIGRYHSNLAIEVSPHREDLSHVRSLQQARQPKERFRIGIVGAIGPHKGSGIVLKCAREARANGAPLEFVLAGYSSVDSELQRVGVEITGKYEEMQVGALLQQLNLDLIFLPSVWPETFCYTLSIAMATTLPICVFDLGAQSERLSGYAGALRLPLHLMEDANEVNTAIARHLLQGFSTPRAV